MTRQPRRVDRVSTTRTAACVGAVVLCGLASWPGTLDPRSASFVPGAAPLGAQEAASPPVPPPLFASDEVVALTIRAPLEDIFRHRDQESEEYEGVILVTGPDGPIDSVDVDIRTRGRTRLDRRICRFPPLRLDFPRRRVAGTLFEGQNRVKLVTHCQDRDDYEQYVLLESLVYRAFNALTDVSFRVRLARITYQDTARDGDARTRYGFLIEHEDGVAERAGLPYLETQMVLPDAADPESLAVLEVFQYLIGNADWSAFQADPGSDECCHNTKPLGSEVGPVFSLPYDFDISGIVDTRYANNLFRANLEKLGLRSVRQRRFRGLCRSRTHWPSVFALFNERRAEIEGLFRGQEGLDEDVLEETLEYIGDFYEVINDESRVEREFERHCVDA